MKGRCTCVGVAAALLVQPLLAQVQITEFMASNSRTLQDDFGEHPDWIEICNTSPIPVNLLDWALTDNANKPTKWLFPSTNLPPYSYLVVFASGRDRHAPGAPLHTNFKTDASGGYLALFRPDGRVATEFVAYPGQLADISYGFALQSATNVAITTNSTGRAWVPTDAALETNWMRPDLDDTGWLRATNGIGFETGQSEDPGTVPASVLANNPAGYWRLGETSATATNFGWIAGTGDGSFVGNVTKSVSGPRPAAWPGFEPTNLAARFDGSSAKVEVPFTPDLNPSAAFTVEAWVKPARKGGVTGCPVSSINVSSGRAGYAIYQDYDVKNQWEFLLGNNSGYIARATGGAVDTNNWQYLAGVYDGSTAQLYLNGTLVATAALGGSFAPNAAEKFVIGGRINASNPYYYAGDIDEVSLIARALSAAEIAGRYQVATNGLAATNVFNYAGLIKTDLRTRMFGLNSSAYLRLPFVLTNASEVNRLNLRARYDDGLAAYLNGVDATADNAPDALNWESTATNRRPTADALQFRNFDLSPVAGYLHDGTNLLALQGLNVSASNTDFLLQIELEAVSLQYGTEARYFTQPTPGGANTVGVRELGPIIAGDGFFPARPGTNDSLTITCRVAQAFAPLTNVALNWRVMYGNLQTTPMYDDGLHGDGAAGDGLYGGVIPNAIGTNWTYTAGQMLRWYITATDSLSRTSRWPLFTDPAATAEYDGTVVQPDYVTSQLPVFLLFVDPANYSGMDAETGARASFYYDGEFYDNIYIERRGNTTAGFAKKSHRLEFNDEHQLRHPGPGGRIGKTSLLAEFMDPAYLRQYLSFWLQDLAGVPAPFDYPVRVERNGQFYELAFHSDVLGAELMDRLGYDRQDALYKSAGIVVTSHFSTGGFQKMLPKTNSVVAAGTADFDALANAISESLPVGLRRTNACDVLNLPQIVNYIAVTRLTQEGDDVWANMTMYRDTFGSGEWGIIPYDLNLSWGQLYYGDIPAIYGVINVTNDFYKSHPLYGGSQVQQGGSSNWNRIYDVMFAVPELRQMVLRRLRTLMDAYFQPPGLPPGQGLIEQQVSLLTNRFWVEAHLDRQLWGWPPNGGPYGWGPNLWLTNGVKDLLNFYLSPRRSHLFVTHCVTNTAKPIGSAWTSNAGIPDVQPAKPLITVVGFDYNPTSGNQDEEYVCLANANAFAADISGWNLAGGIQHTFKPGTIISANNTLYVSPNVAAFRARAVAPHGGMGLFVQGNYQGRLNAWGESLTLTDSAGQPISTNSYAGTPSDAQRYLRITEIMYNPAPLAGNTNDPQDFEYLELKNISTNTPLNLAGVRLSDGIDFTFTGSAVTNLGPGQTVLVVRNLTAFSLRYGGSGFSIASQYSGALANGGENLRLDDAVGEKILEFSYDNRWYPITDGLGFSLVIADENAPWDTWGQKASWRASSRLSGSPGLSDPLPLTLPPILVNEALTHSDPQSDWIELYNPASTNVNLGGWFLTDDFYVPNKYQIPDGTVIGAGGFLFFSGATTFEAGAKGFRLSEYGEQVYLFSADDAANLTGYYHGFNFGAAPNNVSFGRYLNSQGEEDFVLQSTPTPGTNNALPRVGPIVISEIMYHPPDYTNGADNSLDEFIELQNLTAGSVPLFDTFTNEAGYGLMAVTNTWRLRNVVDYDFATNTALAAGSRLLLVGFDPVTNTTQVAAFRALYSVPTNVPVLGPWAGKLDNRSATIELKSPDKPDVTSSNVTIPYVMIDRVAYQDSAPWPTEADGLGKSLQRTSLAAYGNDPTNWVAAAPTAGRISAFVPRPVITVSPAPIFPFTVLVPTSPGLDYTLEYKNDLNEPAWIPLAPILTGDGTIQPVSDTNAPAARRFYQIRAE